MAVAEELVTILGVEVSKNTLQAIQSFKQGLDSVVAKAKSLSLIATGFAAAAGLMVKSTMDEVAALQTMSDKTGVSTQALQEWGYAAKQAGVSAGAVQGDLAKLQKQMMWTGKTGEEQMGKFADKLAGMSDQKAQAYGQAFGLSADTIVILKQGSEGVAKLRKEANELGAVIPEDQIKRSEQFRQSLLKMTETFKGLRTHLAVAMMPALERITDLFTQFIVKNREWIASKTESFMNALVNAWEKIWSVIKKVLSLFQPLIDKFKEINTAMDDEEHLTHILQGAFAGLLIIFAPLIAKIVALGAAFYAASLIVEDFMYWLNGDESLIGYGLTKFAEKFPGITKLFETLKNVAKELFTGIIEWMAPIGAAMWDSFLSGVDTVMVVIDELSNTFANWINDFTERYPAVVKAFKALADFLQGTLIAAFQGVMKICEALWQILGRVIDGIGGLIGGGLDALNKRFSWLGFGGRSEDATRAMPKTVPAGSSEKGGTTNNDNRTNNVQITVSTPEQGQQVLAPYMGSGAQATSPGLHAPTVG